MKSKKNQELKSGARNKMKKTDEKIKLGDDEAVKDKTLRNCKLNDFSYLRSIPLLVYFI